MADAEDNGTMEVTTRISDNDDANSSVYGEEIENMIAIGSVVSPIRSPDITTTQDGGEYEVTVNKRNERKQRKREVSSRGENSGSSAASPHAKLPNKRETPDRVRQVRDTRSRTLYLKGRGYNLGKEVNNRPQRFREEFVSLFQKEPTSCHITGDCVRIVCADDRQRTEVLKAVTFNGRDIDVSEPRAKPGRPQAPVTSRQPIHRVSKGVIIGVSPEISDEEITDMIGNEWSRRIEKYSNGAKVRTTAVIVAFSGDLPASVNLGLLKFKVRVYVPAPMRCAGCNRYGHKISVCRLPKACARCSGAHDFTDCPNIGDPNGIKCVNCKGAHSAAYRGCPKYVEVSKALEISAKDRISYRDALKSTKMTERRGLAVEGDGAAIGVVAAGSLTGGPPVVAQPRVTGAPAGVTSQLTSTPVSHSAPLIASPLPQRVIRSARRTLLGTSTASKIVNSTAGHPETDASKGVSNSESLENIVEQQQAQINRLTDAIGVLSLSLIRVLEEKTFVDNPNYDTAKQIRLSHVVAAVKAGVDKKVFDEFIERERVRHRARATNNFLLAAQSEALKRVAALRQGSSRHFSG